MLIEELDRQSCVDLLSRTRLGRLACSDGRQPYVVPFYFASDADAKYVYSFSMFGKKIEWMRTNPLVCVEADEVVSRQKWTTVIVFGGYEELPDTPQWSRERAAAHSLLRSRAMWWEPAYAKTAVQGGVHSPQPLFYRIHIDKITGRRATPEPSLAARSSTTSSFRGGWMKKISRRLHGD